MKKYQQARKSYPSDISRKQFEQIAEALKNCKKRTKPRTIDLYEVFCALLYVLKSGCQWRMLPSDFPKWRTVHQYYLDWGNKASDGEDSLLEQCLKKIGWRGPHQIRAQRANEFLYH